MHSARVADACQRQRAIYRGAIRSVPASERRLAEVHYRHHLCALAADASGNESEEVQRVRVLRDAVLQEPRGAA